MSGADRERRRRRRQRARTAAASTDDADLERYTRIVLDHLRRSKLIVEDDEPVVAMQKRHVHNRQHAIPFRQQFIERLAHDVRYLDRQVAAHRQKLEAKSEAERARMERQLEKMFKTNAIAQKNLGDTYAKKEREMSLYNNRTLVRELLQDHLKNSTPEGQLRRILQLEENYAKLKRDHDELVRGVNANAHRCDQDKHQHDADMQEVNGRLEQCQTGLGENKQMLVHMSAEHRERLNELQQGFEFLKNQNATPSSLIQDFLRQKDTIAWLTGQIEQLRQMTSQLQNSLAQWDSLKALPQHMAKAEKTLTDHNDALRALAERQRALSTLESLLAQTVQGLNGVQQQLPTIARVLKQQSGLLNHTNTLATSAHTQIEEMRQVLDNMRGNLTALPAPSYDRRLDQPVAEISNVASLAAELDAIKQQLADLQGSITPQNLPDDQSASKETVDLEDKLSQQLEAQVKMLIDRLNSLQAQVDDLRRNQEAAAMKRQNGMSSQLKRIPYLEALIPHDLLDDA